MKPGDSQLELLIGRVLRIGVLVSTVCLAAGLALALAQPNSSPMLLNAGILLLIATPAARVVRRRRADENVKRRSSRLWISISTDTITR